MLSRENADCPWVLLQSLQCNVDYLCAFSSLSFSHSIFLFIRVITDIVHFPNSLFSHISVLVCGETQRKGSALGCFQED